MSGACPSSNSSSVKGVVRQRQQQQARSFGGCDTCRRRRIKCDESRPACNRCRKSRLVCPGYTKSIHFQLDTDSSDGSVRRHGFRRLVLTEAARREMSNRLLTSVPGNITDCLSQIDEASLQDSGIQQELPISCGPFNVFSATSQSTPQLTIPDEIPLLVQDDDGFIQQLDEMPQIAQWHIDLDLDLDFAPILAGQPLQRSLEVPVEATWSGSHISALPPGTQYATSQSNVDPSQQPQFVTEPPLTTDQALFLVESASIPRSPSTNNQELQSVLFLINHFTNTIVTYLTPWRHEKTLWHIFFVPHMRECIALLMLKKPITHADQAIFNGFSAITALSIGGACGSQMWLDKGEVYRQRSYEACQIMLQGAYDTHKKYRYKRILMALQVAVLMSTLKGDPVTEEYYFLEMEKLIKLKGLGRKNSRKVQMLHRFYAYERLIYESTCMRGIDVNHRQKITNDVNSVSVVPYQDDNMAFRVPDWGSLGKRDNESAAFRSDAGATVDNEVLGLWPDALCAQVAGIPEQWITVLFHTVLLGKHKDAVEQSGRSDAEQLQEFLARAKTLEKCLQKQVLHVDLHALPESLAGRKASGESWLDVLDCFRNALHMYFYRRIYDMPSLWLQDKVEKVRQCLVRIAEGHPSSGDPHHSGSIGVLWASFIASCEAEGDELQAFFTDWYKQAAAETGISTWLNSLRLSQQIWEAKRTASGLKTTWIDVLREQRKNIVQQMPIQVVAHG